MKDKHLSSVACVMYAIFDKATGEYVNKTGRHTTRLLSEAVLYQTIEQAGVGVHLCPEDMMPMIINVYLNTR